VRIAQQLIDATVFAEQVAAETRHDFDIANQLLADEPSAYHQKLANDIWQRHVIAARHAQEILMNSLEAVKAADKIRDENAPMPAYGHDDLAPATTEEEKTEEEWDRMEAELVRDEEEAMDAFDLADQDSTKKDEAYMVLLLGASIEEMDHATAMDADEEAEKEFIEIDGVVYGQAW
jgi:hypothetical protein